MDFGPPPSAADNLGLGNENVIGAELRKTLTQPMLFPGVLVNVGTFNLGGGPANAVSLRRLLDHVSNLLGREVDIRTAGWRPGDQRWFVADRRAIDRALALPPKLDWHVGVERLANWLADQRGFARRAAPECAATVGAR